MVWIVLALILMVGSALVLTVAVVPILSTSAYGWLVLVGIAIVSFAPPIMLSGAASRARKKKEIAPCRARNLGLAAILWSLAIIGGLSLMPGTTLKERFQQDGQRALGFITSGGTLPAAPPRAMAMTSETSTPTKDRAPGGQVLTVALNCNCLADSTPAATSVQGFMRLPECLTDERAAEIGLAMFTQHTADLKPDDKSAFAEKVKAVRTGYGLDGKSADPEWLLKTLKPQGRAFLKAALNTLTLKKTLTPKEGATYESCNSFEGAVARLVEPGHATVRTRGTNQVHLHFVDGAWWVGIIDQVVEEKPSIADAGVTDATTK